MAKPAHPVLSEEELGKQWDKCIYNGMVKMGGGLAVGLVASLLIYKSKAKRWPLILGTGFGLGFAYAQCQKDLNETLKPKMGQKVANA
ncbi:MICOS complex subunit Mic10 [Bemisia tabaci]|uniref:MICOS complex subunit Mic10 n=1 Tax=Bemisia tabaci TaxID=7038 RepID=UPI0008F9BE4B|nr:PREDICTED: MICOS complex subunit Mic10-like [Bemisia tabaci]XP_018916079.1 PREDICTED: MICOS complex subunit Mic10-like [Bemisia tabaci]